MQFKQKKSKVVVGLFMFMGVLVGFGVVNVGQSTGWLKSGVGTPPSVVGNVNGGFSATGSLRTGTGTVSGASSVIGGSSPPGTAITSVSQNNNLSDPVLAATANQPNPAIVSIAPDARDLCHSLAAHPLDPARDAGGVDDATIDINMAFDVCAQAIEQYPDDVLVAFQLARAALPLGYYSIAEELLAHASEQGHAASQTLLAELWLQTEDLNAEDLQLILMLLQNSVSGGFYLGQNLLDELESFIATTQAASPATASAPTNISGTGRLVPSAPKSQGGFNASLFEQKLVMSALYAGDFDALQRFEAGFVLEDYGVHKAFHEYAKSFSETLNQMWVCPSLLRAGVTAKINAQSQQQTLAIVRDPNKSVTIALDVLTDLFGGVSGSSNGSEALFEGLMDMEGRVIKGQALTATLTEMGLKDALTLRDYFYPDCGQPGARPGEVARRIAANLAHYVFNEPPE